MFANVRTGWYSFWNSKRATLKHLILALSLVVGIYISYTAFRAGLPSPEVLSPFAYLLAFVASLIAYLRLENRKNSRFSLFILLLCALALLDEISYGVEPGFVKPIYVDKYNVYIYDLHNLIGLVVELIQIFLMESNWNTALFVKFLQIDLFAILLSATFIIILRARLETTRLDDRILRQVAIFFLVAGSISVLSLALLPTDPKNAWLFTYSRFRVAIMSGILLISSFPIAVITYVSRNTEGKQHRAARLLKSVYSKNSLRRLQILAPVVTIAGLIYQFWTPFITYPDQKVIVDRITPIVAWAIFSSILLLSAVQAWNGKFMRPMIRYLDPLRGFAKDNPAMIYALTAVLLIIVAQVNDKGWVVLGEYFAIPNIRIADWGWWTEEVFEFTAAIEFYIASLFFPKDV